jgi:hypothetical protein
MTHMRAGNGKGLQPSHPRIIQQTPGWIWYDADTHKQGAQWLRTEQVPAVDHQSLQTGRSGVLRACRCVPRSPGPNRFPGAAPPRSHVPMFPCSHGSIGNSPSHAGTTHFTGHCWTCGVFLLVTEGSPSNTASSSAASSCSSSTTRRATAVGAVCWQASRRLGRAS